MRTIAPTVLCMICLLSCTQEVTNWRGPTANGVYYDTGLSKEWPSEGPELLWHFEGLGGGYSSPVFANRKIYINGLIDSTGYIFILNNEGELVNKFAYGEEFTRTYPGTRSSVTVAGNRLYVMSSTGRLVCMNTEDGSVIWDKHMFSDFDGKNLTHGISETVVVEGDKLYCTPGGTENNMVCLDRFTGDLIWSSSGMGKPSSYCTPLRIDLPSRKILVTITTHLIICIDALDGTLLWSHDHPNIYGIHANTPIYHDGSVFCFGGWEQGGVMIELDDHGNKKNVRWEEKAFGSQMGGAVLVDGTIYGCGDKHVDRGWKSIDWETGEMGYNSSSLDPGVVIYSDGNLYCYSQKGELVMVPANPKEFKVTGRTKVQLGDGQHWAHPVINRGRLFVRHGNALIAYDLS